MSFTDRFILLPSTVVSTKEVDMMGEERAPEHEVVTRLNPLDISYYEESDRHKDKGNFNYTQVVLKSGQGFIVLLPITKFERLLNEFMSK